MAAKKGGGCLGFLVLVLIAVVLFTMTSVSNVFNIKIIFSHGLGQYFSNILHLHNDKYCIAKTNLEIYDQKLPIERIRNTQELLSLKLGDRF